MPIELFKFSITSMYHFYNKQKNQTLCFKKPDQQRPKVNMTSRLWTQGQGLWVSSLCLWSCPLHPLLRHAVMETFREARWSAGDVTLRGVASGGTCPFWMQLEGVCTVTWTKQFPRIWGGPSWSGEFSHLCEHWGDIFIVRACLVTSVLSDSLWPMDYSPPDSSVHGILQARILELFAMPSSRGSSQPRDHTQAWYWQAGSWPLVPPGKHMFRVGIHFSH